VQQQEQEQEHDLAGYVPKPTSQTAFAARHAQAGVWVTERTATELETELGGDVRTKTAKVERSRVCRAGQGRAGKDRQAGQGSKAGMLWAKGDPG
jgi:hypothetical protein